VDGRDKPGHDENESHVRNTHFAVSTPASLMTFAHLAISAAMKS
jgi:hypothetical protein